MVRYVMLDAQICQNHLVTEPQANKQFSYNGKRGMCTYETKFELKQLTAQYGDIQVISFACYRWASLVAHKSTYQCRRHGFNLWVRRSPGRGNGNPLQHSCLGNPLHRGAWWATGHGVAKELDMTEQLNNKEDLETTSSPLPSQKSLCHCQRHRHLSTYTGRTTVDPRFQGRSSCDDGARVPAKSPQSCLTFCDPRDCSPPGSSAHGILPARRILEWVAIPFSRGSSGLRK